MLPFSRIEITIRFLLTIAACLSLDKKSLLALPAGSSCRCDSRPDFGNAMAGGVLDGCVDQNIPRSLGRIAFNEGDVVLEAAFAFEESIVVVLVVEAGMVLVSDRGGSSSMVCRSV